MQPNTAISAADLTLTGEPVPADQSVAGEPTTGDAALTEGT